MPPTRSGPLVALVLLAGTLLPAQPAQAQAAGIESEILSLINGGRSTRAVMHSGLRVQARAHSQTMARRGGLTHAGAATRIQRAAPDPPEASGPPDSGFTGNFCENTGWVEGVSASAVAQQMIRMWRNSSTHRPCMYDTNGLGTNVAGVGAYQDGDRWWVTLELVQDRTPPGSGGETRAAAPAAAAAPAPRPTPPPPTAPPTPVPTPRPTPTPLHAISLFDLPPTLPAPPPDNVGLAAEIGTPDLLSLYVFLGAGAALAALLRRRR